MSDTATAKSHGPTPEQKEFTKTAVRADIKRICDAWPLAIKECGAIGYGTGFNGSEATVKSSAVSDPTFSRAMRPDTASEWVADAQKYLVFIIRHGDVGHVRGERPWSGPFSPPAISGSICAAAEDIVELWPVRLGNLLQQISRLASLAVRYWPETPKPGQTIETTDGPVTIHARSQTVEMCEECRSVIGGTAADPLARIDGKPYHLNPCHKTVKAREYRRRG